MIVSKPQYLIVLILNIISISIIAQDIIQKTNGAQINANVVEVGKDSVWFKNKNLYGSPLVGLPKSEIKMIEYWNGEKDYFHGSYMNLSEAETGAIKTGFDAGNHSLYLEYILFTVENLFTENHLILDYSNHQDSAFTVSKGKMEFVFIDKRNNFFVKFFPTDNKTVFTKFEFADGAKNKRYEKLTNFFLESLVVYMNDSVSFMTLSEEQAIDLKNLFSSKDFKEKD